MLLHSNSGQRTEAREHWKQATCWARDHWPSVPKAVTRAVQDTTSGLMPQRPRISSNSAAPRRQSPPAAHALITAAKAWPAHTRARAGRKSGCSRKAVGFDRSSA